MNDAMASADDNFPVAIFLANQFLEAISCRISDVKPG